MGDGPHPKGDAHPLLILPQWVGWIGFWVTLIRCLLDNVRWNWVLCGVHHLPASVDIPRWPPLSVHTCHSPIMCWHVLRLQTLRVQNQTWGASNSRNLHAPTSGVNSRVIASALRTFMFSEWRRRRRLDCLSNARICYRVLSPSNFDFCCIFFWQCFKFKTIASISAFTLEFRVANSVIRAAKSSRECAHSEILPSNASRHVAMLTMTSCKQRSIQWYLVLDTLNTNLGGALYVMFENHVRSWPLLKNP